MLTLLKNTISGTKRISRCIFITSITLAVVTPKVWAAPEGCIEEGGQKYCGRPNVTEWGYDGCSEEYWLGEGMAWCQARGGTQAGYNAPCIGAVELDESNIASIAFAFAQLIHSNTCSLVSDSGWGATSFSSNCWSGPPQYQNNLLIRDNRKFFFTCTTAGNQTVWAKKDRQVNCLPGFAALFDSGGSRYCSRAVESTPLCQAGKDGNPAAPASGTAAAGNPITVASGVKFERETDYVGAGGLVFTRHYHGFGFYSPYSAVAQRTSQLGSAWHSNFDRRIFPVANSNYVSAGTSLPNGDVQYFKTNGGSFFNYGGTSSQLIAAGTGYLHKVGDTAEEYDANGLLVRIVNRDGQYLSLTYSTSSTPLSIAPRAGLLIQVSDQSGRSLSFEYDVKERLVKLIRPDGLFVSYVYDGPTSVVLTNQRRPGNITTVLYPDSKSRTYWYNEQSRTASTNIPSALTGITDERGVRYGIYSYDSSGRAISSEHSGGVDRHTLAFGTNSTVVTDPLGTQRTYNFQTVLGVVKSTGQSQPGGSGCGPAAEAVTYDANGNVSSRTDFNGKKTTYVYDLTRNLETSRTEGLASSGAALPETRTITTSWHATWRLPVQVNEYAGASASGNPLRRTSTAYDDKGNVVSRSVTDVAAGQTRTWNTSYTYSTAVPGLILQKVEDGPRTDVTDTTVTEYYPHDEVCAGAGLGTGRDKGCRGQVKRVTNTLGQVTQFTRYNAHGQAEEIIDPNGVITTLTYDLRQRLTSRATAGETTSFQYDGVGQLTRLTQPDGSYIAYTYDNARRLTQIADNLGNTIAYTLDAAGNRTREEIFDPQGALAKTLVRAYDALGRMQTLTGVGNE